MIGIYKYTNKYDRKVYIGKSSNIARRKTMHKTNAKANRFNCHFHNAIRKYGIDAFDFEILIECPIENLNYWEKFYIRYYCSNNPDYGYNETDGGDGVCGIKRSKEAIDAARQGAIDWWAIPENKERMREKQKGHPGYTKGFTPWNKGLTKEVDDRMKDLSEKLKGNQLFLGHHHKEESKEKIE